MVQVFVAESVVQVFVAESGTGVCSRVCGTGVCSRVYGTEYFLACKIYFFAYAIHLWNQISITMAR